MLLSDIIKSSIIQSSIQYPQTVPTKQTVCAKVNTLETLNSLKAA